MVSQRVTETTVGLFLLFALAALGILAIKVSGLTSFFHQAGYEVRADFDDIGQLKIRGPVKIGGVTVGEVVHISLDPESYKAKVVMRIDKAVNDIPDDSTVGILTAGLLGDNYIAITPMYSTQYLKNGSVIEETHSAMILEKMIGQFLFSVGQSQKSSKKTETGA